MRVYALSVLSEEGKLIQQEVFLSRHVAIEMYVRAIKLHGESLVHLNPTPLNAGPLMALIHEATEQTRLFGAGLAINLFRGLLTVGAKRAAKDSR